MAHKRTDRSKGPESKRIIQMDREGKYIRMRSHIDKIVTELGIEYSQLKCALEKYKGQTTAGGYRRKHFNP